MSVVLETSVGTLVIDLHVNECPNACKNFLKLCKSKYYNNCLFFKIEKNFVARTGDPTGTGKGGSSFEGLNGGNARFPKEISRKIRHNRIGSVGMIPDRAGNGSSFYITLRKDVKHLDGKMTLFAQVEEGVDILTKLNDLYCDNNGRPYQDMRIRHAHILDDPFDDPKNHEYPASPEGRVPDAETVEPRIADDEEVDPDEGKTKAEMEAQIRAETAHANAVALTLMGDLPHAEVKPEDNVLFVCQLNPHTQDEDLELIFSRFGEVQRCDIIRDFRTGDSLQYAFIEFDTHKSCEEAYWKMNGVIIDDRRIKVDFSQSVAKIYNKYETQPWLKEARQYIREKDAKEAMEGNANEAPLGKRQPTKSRFLENTVKSAAASRHRQDQKPKHRESDRSRSKRDRHRDHERWSNPRVCTKVPCPSCSCLSDRFINNSSREQKSNALLFYSGDAIESGLAETEVGAVIVIVIDDVRPCERIKYHLQEITMLKVKFWLPRTSAFKIQFKRPLNIVLGLHCVSYYSSSSQFKTNKTFIIVVDGSMKEQDNRYCTVLFK